MNGPSLTQERLLSLYGAMLRIRLVEERIADRYADQKMRCPVHLCIGQEAVSAGVSYHLRATDYVFSGHRSHGHYLAKGGDLDAMIAEIYGKATGCSNGKGGSMHLIDLGVGFLGATPIVGSTIPIAMGAAFHAWQNGEDHIAVAYLGDAATETGVFHETLNFAATMGLPLLLVCENNLYSVYSPMAVRQPTDRPIADLARGHHIFTRTGNGNDVAEVDALAGEAVAHVRTGNGPAFLEFATYRWREHCGPNYDNHIGYRTPEEYERWRATCPIDAARHTLTAEFGIAASELDSLAAAINKTIDTAFARAEAAPFPDDADRPRHVYA